MIPVEKGEFHEDKHSVHLKDPSFVKITNQDNKEIGVLDKSGITNEVEARTTIDEGADIDKESQIEALEQFPSWHPQWKELHVELYKKFQKIDKLYPEPIFEPSSPVANDIQKLVASAFGSYLNCELT